MVNAVFIVFGGLVFSIVVGLWLYFSRDQTHAAATIDLFCFSPLWPLMRYKRALWILLGMMILAGGLAECFESFLNTRSLLGGLATCIVGTSLIAAAFAVGKLKKHA